MNSCAAICGFEAPSPARRAISASWAVRAPAESTVRLRACSPVARSSMRARSANAAAPTESNLGAAAQVAGLAEERALDLSEALARHSLVQLDDSSGWLRCRMLQTIGEFVAERL